MRKRIFLILMMVAVSGALLAVRGSVLCPEVQAAEQKAKGLYHCPMHPQITSDRKGPCPICGMDLVKSEEPAEEAAQAPGKAVLISSGKQQLIGVKKEKVGKRPLTVEIASVGKVAYDPELYVAQEEYVQALKIVAGTEKSSLVSIREQSAGLLASAEKKLLLSGMSKPEIEALKQSGKSQDNLYSSVNSGKAWVYITIYEYEMSLVKPGQKVVVDALAYPGKVFKGRVTALTPVLNAESRSVRARAEVEDKDGMLKPEMFVNAKILLALGEKLAVPEEAVMDSGTRKIVYVVSHDRFEAREVSLGPKAGEFYEVSGGLKEGEEVVTSGNFLIDAESKLKGAL